MRHGRVLVTSILAAVAACGGGPAGPTGNWVLDLDATDLPADFPLVSIELWIGENGGFVMDSRFGSRSKAETGGWVWNGTEIVLSISARNGQLLYLPDEVHGTWDGDVLTLGGGPERMVFVR